MSTFRALWPIVNESMPLGTLIDEARRDLPALTRRARVRLTGPGRYTVADSTTVPGSGRVSRLVLVYTGPAEPKPQEWPPGGRIADPPEPITGAPEDVDPLVVAHLLNGDRIPHTKAERWETIRRWEGSGNALERLHGWNVVREKKAMRAAELVAS